MTTAEQSEASSDAVSSTFGLPGGASDTDSDTVLCKTHKNGPSLDASIKLNLPGGNPPKMEGRGVYRLAFVILCLVLGLLLDSRRLVDAAALMLS